MSILEHAIRSNFKLISYNSAALIKIEKSIKSELASPLSTPSGEIAIQKIKSSITIHVYILLRNLFFK